MSNGNDMAFPVLDNSQTPNDTTQLGLTKREVAAIALAQGMLAANSPFKCWEDCADAAVQCADALLARLLK